MTLASEFIKITWYQEMLISHACLCMSPINRLHFSENSTALFVLLVKDGNYEKLKLFSEKQTLNSEVRH